MIVALFVSLSFAGAPEVQPDLKDERVRLATQLDVLDSLAFRLVTIGFPLLTVGIVTGAIVAARIGGEEAGLNASRLTAMLAWLFFAGVLFLRVLAGWRGRRAAIGTMLGFVCAVFVLVGYVIRAEAF